MRISVGASQTALGLMGDTSRLDIDLISALVAPLSCAAAAAGAGGLMIEVRNDPPYALSDGP